MILYTQIFIYLHIDLWMELGFAIFIIVFFNIVSCLEYCPASLCMGGSKVSEPIGGNNTVARLLITYNGGKIGIPSRLTKAS